MALGLAHQELDDSVPTHLQKASPEALLKDTHETVSSLPISDMEEVDYETLPTDKLSVHLVAGGAAGIMEHCAMYPVDCVKRHVDKVVGSSRLPHNGVYSPAYIRESVQELKETRMMTLFPNPKARYNNIFEAFYKIVTQEKPRALFRGMGVVATGAGPAHALYFACYEYSKKVLSNGNGSSVLAQGGAGAISSIVHDGFMNPVEVIKQRLQMYNTPYKGVVDCARTIYRTEGIKAFYRSYTTQLSMNVPFQVLHFISYELQQDIWNSSRKYDPLSHMLSGAGAGAIAAALTTPLDVAKTLLNTQEQKIGVDVEQRVQGMVNAMIKIYKTSGVRGYFKGVSARIIYQMPSTAICWSVYEFFKHTLSMKEQGGGAV